MKLEGLGFGGSRVPCRERVYSRLSLQLETGQGRDRTTQRGRYPRFLRVVAHVRVGKAPLSGHKLASGAGHCFLDCGGLSHQ